MKPNHEPIKILEVLRDKLQRGADGLDVAGDSGSSSWLENMADDVRTVLGILNDREDAAFEAMIALAFRSDPPDPNPMTAEDVDEANLPELTDEEKAAVDSIDIEAIIAKGNERPTDSAVDAACAVYDRIVGEATTMGHLSTVDHPNDPLGNPNKFGVRVNAGEFKRIVARAIDAARLSVRRWKLEGTAEQIIEQIENALRDDAAADESRFNSFSRFFLEQIVLEARCPRSPIERWEPADPDPEAEAAALDAAGKAFKPVSADELAGAVKCSGGPEHLPECGGTCGDLKPTEAEVEYTALDWGEYQARINASLAKCAEADHKAEVIDTFMAAGMLAVSAKGGAMIALAEVFATLIPDGEPLNEIPDGWAPVALAINPMTGEFLTLAGPRSAPDGRVEPLETMLAKWNRDSLSHALGAVREAGRRALEPDGEGEPAEPVLEGEDAGPCPRRREGGPWNMDEHDRWSKTRWKGEGDWRLEWFPRSCSFCGSIHPDDAMRLLEKGWEPEIARGKAYKFYLHPPGYGYRMRASLEGIREKGVEGMVDGWSPTPPVKAYTPHFSQRQIDRVTERVRQLKEGE